MGSSLPQSSLRKAGNGPAPPHPFFIKSPTEKRVVRDAGSQASRDWQAMSYHGNQDQRRRYDRDREWKFCCCQCQCRCQHADANIKQDDDDPLDILVVSYSRKVLQQTGSGHFSPLAAYDATSDSVLILDMARFKYGAHWVPLPLIFDAMRPIDPDTGKSRGYTLVSFVPHTTPASSTDATVITTSTSTTTNHVSTTLMGYCCTTHVSLISIQNVTTIHSSNLQGILILT